jgi:hypothetical protein
MKDIKFNIYGYTAPQTRAEYIALLDEALRLADDLGEQLDCIGDLAAKHAETTQ